MLKYLKWVVLTVVAAAALFVGIIAFWLFWMYFNFAKVEEHQITLKVPETDSKLIMYSKRSHPMLPEFHRRMVVEQPGLPAQDVEIWPDPVGHNVLDVYATRAIEGMHVTVSDPKMATQQGVWFNQVLPFSSSATSETFTTKTHVGHFDTKHMKWFNPNETPWL